MLLKISPTTFCINTNQISPINLLHLISLSTSPALASHRQLKLPYWQMHTNNFFCPPSQSSIVQNQHVTTALAGLHLSCLSSKSWRVWNGRAELCSCPNFAELLPWDSQVALVPNSGVYVGISAFPVQPWHISVQLHSGCWMFYPWLPLMLSSSDCFKAAWCHIKAAAQTKHIQAGSWGGKRENLQQSAHAGCFFFCFNGSEGHAGDLLAEGGNFIGVSLARQKIQPIAEWC